MTTGPRQVIAAPFFARSEVADAPRHVAHALSARAFPPYLFKAPQLALGAWDKKISDASLIQRELATQECGYTRPRGCASELTQVHDNEFDDRLASPT